MCVCVSEFVSDTDAEEEEAPALADLFKSDTENEKFNRFSDSKLYKELS